MTWEIDVPADGHYSLAFAYRPEMKEDFPVYRSVLVDGFPPFQEARSYPFPFTAARWRAETRTPDASTPVSRDPSPVNRPTKSLATFVRLTADG